MLSTAQPCRAGSGIAFGAGAGGAAQPGAGRTGTGLNAGRHDQGGGTLVVENPGPGTTALNHGAPRPCEAPSSPRRPGRFRLPGRVGHLRLIVTAQQIELAAEIAERHVREALQTGDDLGEATVHAVHVVPQAWRPGFISSEDPDLSEPPGMAGAELN
jgi:hypothetical protein